MSYTHKVLHFPSSDGINTSHAEMFIPEGNIRGAVMISHGMRDYIGRYKLLCEYLTERGFLVAGNDHLGHGATSKSSEDFGYFAKKDGYKLVISDLLKMNSIVKDEFPGVPVFLLGHSMGSFLARLYAQLYPDTIEGVIIHGTGGKNPLLPVGKAIIALVELLFGSRHRSRLVTGIAFGAYNARFDKSEGDEAWLTREGELVADRRGNPYTDFIFTAAGYRDLFNMIGLSNSKAHFEAYPKSLPTLVMSGGDDPVGDFGKGVRFVYDSLKGEGVSDLTLKIYDGARHELFNETNRDEVFSDIAEWLERYLSK